MVALTPMVARVTNPRVEILSALLAVVAIAPHAEAEDPQRVTPSSGTVRELRKVSTEAADTLGKYLDGPRLAVSAAGTLV